MRKYTSLLAVLCILFFVTSTATAASSQGMDWGISVEDRFDFHFRYVDYANPEYSRSLDFYFEVASLTAIPDSITAIQSLPYLNITTDFDYYYANSTALGPLSNMMPCLALPIGNWTHWTILFESVEFPVEREGSNIDASESSSTWSYSANYIFEEGPSDVGSATYLKENGVLTSYHWMSYNDAGAASFEYEISQVGYEPISPLLLIGVVGVGVVAVVAIILFVKKR